MPKTGVKGEEDPNWTSGDKTMHIELKEFAEESEWGRSVSKGKRIESNLCFYLSN